MALRRYHPIALALIVLHLAACTSWQPTSLSPPQLIQEEEPGQVRLTSPSDDQVVIRNPQVQGDSIGGTDGRESVRVAISDIRQVEVRRFSWGGTAALVGGLGLASFLVSLIVLCGGEPSGYGPSC